MCVSLRSGLKIFDNARVMCTIVTDLFIVTIKVPGVSVLEKVLNSTVAFGFNIKLCYYSVLR